MANNFIIIKVNAIPIKMSIEWEDGNFKQLISSSQGTEKEQ